MSLFAAGVVLFLLLVASYSGRRFWISLASTVMSMVALAGFLFVAIAKEPSAIRTGLIWTAGKIELVVDQPTADTIAKVIEQIPAPTALSTVATPEAPAPESPDTTPPAHSAAASPEATSETNATGAAEPAPAPPQPDSVQAATAPTLPAPQPAPKAATPSLPPPAPAPQATPGSPVAWLLDEQGQASASPGFVISGMNASNAAFEDVRAVLKPDGGHDELALVLDVEGKKSDGTIPAGARFSLALPAAKHAQTGGAILSFRYRQSDQMRTSILYLTPAMVARFANRG